MTSGKGSHQDPCSHELRDGTSLVARGSQLRPAASTWPAFPAPAQPRLVPARTLMVCAPPFHPLLPNPRTTSPRSAGNRVVLSYSRQDPFFACNSPIPTDPDTHRLYRPHAKERRPPTDRSRVATGITICSSSRPRARHSLEGCVCDSHTCNSCVVQRAHRIASTVCDCAVAAAAATDRSIAETEIDDDDT